MEKWEMGNVWGKKIFIYIYIYIYGTPPLPKTYTFSKFLSNTCLYISSKNLSKNQKKTWVFFWFLRIKKTTQGNPKKTSSDLKQKLLQKVFFFFFFLVFSGFRETDQNLAVMSGPLVLQCLFFPFLSSYSFKGRVLPKERSLIKTEGSNFKRVWSRRRNCNNKRGV